MTETEKHAEVAVVLEEGLVSIVSHPLTRERRDVDEEILIAATDLGDREVGEPAADLETVVEADARFAPPAEGGSCSGRREC